MECFKMKWYNRRDNFHAKIDQKERIQFSRFSSKSNLKTFPV